MSEKHKQLDGSKNCMQCAAAYMLGLPLADVPDFEQAGSEAWEAFYEFFAERGFTAEMLPPTMEFDGDYLASGETERGTSHMVVMRGGELLHDPHPSATGLTRIQVKWLIARKAVEAAPQPVEREPLTPREIELIDGMIAVQLDHAMRCDAIANRAMADKQKGWDMERVALLQKFKAAHGSQGGQHGTE